MGLTDFVRGHIPGRNSGRNSGRSRFSADPSDSSTPRRRRMHSKDRASPRESAPLSLRHADRPDTRPAQSADLGFYSDRERRFACSERVSPLSYEKLSPPPPRRLGGWMRARAAARVKSNIEETRREPPTPKHFPDLRAAAAVHAAAASRSADKARMAAGKDPLGESSSQSLKWLLASSGRGGTMQFNTKPRPLDSQEVPRRPQSYRRNNRIRSNMEQFMRKDKEKDHHKEREGEWELVRGREWDKDLGRDRGRRFLPPISGRRGHSQFVHISSDPLDFENEPISVITDAVHSDSSAFIECDPIMLPRSPRFTPSSSLSSTPVNAPADVELRTLPRPGMRTLSTASDVSREPVAPPALVPTPAPLPYPSDSLQKRMSSSAASNTSSYSSKSTTSTSTSTTSSRPSDVLPPPKRRPHPPARPPLQPRERPLVLLRPEDVEARLPLADENNSDVEEEPRSLRRRFADTAIVRPQERISADASYPPRIRESILPTFVRSPSHPTAATQSPVLPTVGSKRAQLRPPPLRTPSNDATGFACGVGGTSLGIREVAMKSNREKSGDMTKSRKSKNESKGLRERERRDSKEAKAKKETKDIKDDILPLQVAVEDREVRSAISPGLGSTPKSKYLSAGGDSDEASNEPNSRSRFDVWSADHSREGSSGSFSGARFSRKPSDRDLDLFYFEEASQSSFGDETPSRRAARNGIVPLERRTELAEVTEDHFIFAADGSFKDGDIIISSEGLVEPPERVMRKRSDGLAVEGVPTSSNNFIFVKSLDEFRKSFTFKAKSNDGSRTLGRGSAGRVYLASHEPTRRKIAVKEINVYDEEKRNQLKKELQTLTNHQSRFLVRTYGAFYDGAGVVHVTLEYMDRGSLSDIVLQRGRIPEPVMCKIAEHCLRGLGFLHDNHILHRDVKTGNILLSRKLCRAKLSDFGLARDLVEGSSVVNTFVGTLMYMSPERLHGSEYTYASDIWGLGISILECVMGRHPFKKPQSFFDIVDAATDSSVASLVEGQVSAELSDFIRLCTQVDPGERPKARDLLQHAWFQSRRDDTNALREWLDTIPRLHCEDVQVGSELAFSAKAAKDAKTMEKMRAFKAQESSL